MRTKETKYQIICVIIFVIAIVIATIARNAPYGKFPTTPEAGFQVQMGAYFSLCIQAIALIIFVRMRKLIQRK